MSTNYTAQTWTDGSTSTPLSAARMAYIETGIGAVDTAATQKATLTTKGDLYAASAASTPARVAVGGDATELRADSTASTGVAWKRHRTPSADKTTAYTVVAADIGTTVVVNSASAVNVTINTGTLTAGDVFEVWQRGAGQVTMVAGAGMTQRAPAGAKTRVQYSIIRIWAFSSTEYVIGLDATV